MEAYLHLDVQQESRDGPKEYKIEKVKATCQIDTWNEKEKEKRNNNPHKRRQKRPVITF